MRSGEENLFAEERGIPKRVPSGCDIQRMALRRGKNLAFSKDTCLEKERVRSKVISTKVGVELKEGLNIRTLGWRLAW